MAVTSRLPSGGGGTEIHGIEVEGTALEAINKGDFVSAALSDHRADDGFEKGVVKADKAEIVYLSEDTFVMVYLNNEGNNATFKASVFEQDKGATVGIKHLATTTIVSTCPVAYWSGFTFRTVHLFENRFLLAMYTPGTADRTGGVIDIKLMEIRDSGEANTLGTTTIGNVTSNPIRMLYYFNIAYDKWNRILFVPYFNLKESAVYIGEFKVSTEDKITFENKIPTLQGPQMEYCYVTPMALQYDGIHSLGVFPYIFILSGAGSNGQLQTFKFIPGSYGSFLDGLTMITNGSLIRCKFAQMGTDSVLAMHAGTGIANVYFTIFSFSKSEGAQGNRIQVSTLVGNGNDTFVCRDLPALKYQGDTVIVQGTEETDSINYLRRDIYFIGGGKINRIFTTRAQTLSVTTYSASAWSSLGKGVTYYNFINGGGSSFAGLKQYRKFRKARNNLPVFGISQTSAGVPIEGEPAKIKVIASKEE